MTVMQEVAGNYFVQMTGKVLSILFGLVTVGVLTRTLGDTGFGEYTTAVTFLSLFGVFVDFGLTLTLVQMISKADADEPRLVGNMLGLRLISGAVFYALAPLVVLLFPYTQDMKWAVAIGSLAFLFMSSAGMLVGVFQKHLQMWRFAAAELVNRALYLALIVALAVSGYGLVEMMIAMVIANFLWLVVTVVLAKPLISIRPRFEIALWMEALRRSWPIALSIIFNLIYLRGDIILLANFRPFSEVGQYGVAYKVVDVLTAIPIMFMGLLLPKLTAAWADKQQGNFKEYLQKAFDLFAVIVIPLVLGAQVVSEALTVFIAGDIYKPAGAVLRVLMLAVFCVFFSALYGHVIVALERQRVMTWGYALTAVLALIGYLLFIPVYGMWGAAWVTFLSEALIASLTFLVVSRVSGAWPNLTIAAKSLTSAAVMYVVLVIIPPLPVLIQVCIGAVIYAAALLGMGGVKWSQLMEMTRLTRPKS